MRTHREVRSRQALLSPPVPPPSPSPPRSPLLLWSPLLPPPSRHRHLCLQCPLLGVVQCEATQGRSGDSHGQGPSAGRSPWPRAQGPQRALSPCSRLLYLAADSSLPSFGFSCGDLTTKPYAVSTGAAGYGSGDHARRHPHGPPCTSGAGADAASSLEASAASWNSRARRP